MHIGKEMREAELEGGEERRGLICGPHMLGLHHRLIYRIWTLHVIVSKFGNLNMYFESLGTNIKPSSRADRAFYS